MLGNAAEKHELRVNLGIKGKSTLLIGVIAETPVHEASVNYCFSALIIV